MSLVERDAEIAFLEDRLADCLRGTGTIAVIRGAVASGKTALLLSLAEQAFASGAIYLNATASRLEKTLQLGLINQLLRSSELPIVISERALELLEDDALSTLSKEQDPVVIAPEVARVFGGLWKLLRDLSEICPVVISIDDVQYADVLSVQFLAYSARRTKDSRILIVLTECTHVLPPDHLLHTEILRQPNCHCITLRWLSRSGVADLLQAQLPGADTQLVTSCHRISGGNPLLVQALAEDYRACEGAATGTMAPWAVFRRAVCACLYRCDPVVADLARVLAVLETMPPIKLLGELLDISPESARNGLHILTTIGILDSGRFRHDVIRKAVLDSMSAGELAALHSRVARVFYLAGVAPAVLAKHLLAADRIEAAWAVPVLEDAAADALASKQPDLAISLLGRAHRESTDERQRAAIKAALARTEWRIAPANAARHFPELVKSAQHRLLDSRHVSELVYYLLWHGHTGYAITVLKSIDCDGADILLQEPGGMLRPWLDFSFPKLLDGMTGLSDEPAAHAAPAGALPQKSVPNFLASVTGCDEEEGSLSELERILEKSNLEEPAQATVITALMALLCADRADRVAFWCDSLQRDARALDIPLWSAIFEAFQAMIETRRGNLAAAERHARTALTLLGPKDWGVVVGGPLASAILAATAARKLEDAAAYVRSPAPEAMFDTPFGLLYLHARGSYYLSTGRLYAALDDFQSCGERMTNWALDLPAFVPWRTAAAQARLRMGDTLAARELAVEQLSRLRPEHIRTRGISLRVLALTERPAKRLALLRQAAEALRASGDRLELAHALADLSGTYAELGEPSRAQTLARQANALAVQCGAESLKAAVPVEASHNASHHRRPALADVDPLEGLSFAERRVANLAAHGYTNREISRKLYVTVSTVEQHLTRVYRKLGLNSRADLPVDLPADFAES